MIPELLPDSELPQRERGLISFSLMTSFILVLCLVLFAYCSLRTVTRAYHSLHYPFQLDPEEGFLLEQSLRLRRGETIYPDLTRFPYTVGNYPPVYPALYGLIGSLSDTPSLPLGRAINQGVLLLIAGAAIGTVHRLTERVLPAILSGLLILSFWDVHQWIAFARVDVLSIAFTTLAIGLVSFKRSPATLVAAALLGVLAFGTKQTQALSFVSLSLYLLMQKEWKSLALYLGSSLVFLLMGLVVTVIVIGGDLTLHLIVANTNEFIPGQVLIWVKHLLRFNAPFLLAVLIAGGFAAVRCTRTWKEHGFPASFQSPLALLWIWCLAAAATIPTIGKAGSACNYLIEFEVAAAIAVCATLGRLMNSAEGGAMPTRLLVTTAFVVLVLLALQAGYSAFGWPKAQFYNFDSEDLAARQLAGEAVLARVTEARGPVLTEEPIFAILAGKEVLFQPFIMTQMAKEGTWDQSSFVKDLERQQFDLVVTTRNIFDEDQFFPNSTLEMREAMRSSYNLEDVLGPYFVLVPRDFAQN